MKKVLNFLSSFLIAVILIVSIVMTAMVIISTRSADGIPSLFGYALFNVKTDSMESEEGFPAGALIILKKKTPETENDFKVGDVITYRRVFNSQEYLDTHRIVPITDEIIDRFGRDHMVSHLRHEIVDGIWIHGGARYFITKGDHEQDIDFNEDGSIQFVSKGAVVGVWTGIQIPVLGKIIEFMQSQLGFMVCIVIPVALFFIYELYVFIVTLSRKKKEEALAEVSDKEEELKKKAIEEFLAQQAAASGSSAEAKDGEAKEAAEPKDDKPAEAEKKEEPAEEKKEEAKEEPAAEEKKDEPAEEAKEETKEEKPAKSADDISEEEKQRIIQEYLAKQAAESAEKKD